MTDATREPARTRSVNFRGLFPRHDLRGPTLLAALWAWLVAVVFPMLVWGVGARWPLGMAFPPIVLLGAVHRSLRVRRVALLLVAPSALALSVFFREELTGADAWDASVRAVLGVAACVYLVVAAAYCEQRLARRSEGERLPASALAPVDAPRRLVQRAFLALMSLASMALLAVAPRFGATGESAELLLATAAGLIVALGLLGTLFGPALRANTTRLRPPENTQWILLSVGIVAFAGWLLLRVAEAR